MADDVKKSDNVCAKVTERMLLDLNRLAAFHDLKLSAFIYSVLRQRLYGEMVRVDRSDENLQE